MGDKQAIRYSIIRYLPDELTGEIVNVGIIMHCIDGDQTIKLHLLPETSPKIKAILQSPTELNTYKSYKDILEYYLKKSDNLFGQVGSVNFSSHFQKNFLEELFASFEKKKLHISLPNFSLTSNMEALFNSLVHIYVDRRFPDIEKKPVNVKNYMRHVFEEKKLLGTKVASDLSITPIKNLKNLKITIDFGYRNGVWNYLQTVPSLSGPTKNSDWFAKTKFMLENIEYEDAKVHLLYRKSDFDKKNDAQELINYFSAFSDRIQKLDLDNRLKFNDLIVSIEQNAHDLGELAS